MVGVVCRAASPTRPVMLRYAEEMASFATFRIPTAMHSRKVRGRNPRYSRETPPCDGWAMGG